MSGDIGFYSGAKKLLEKLDRNEFQVNTEPGISSAVYLCAKIGASWQDVYMTSAHGREANLVGLAKIHPKVFCGEVKMQAPPQHSARIPQIADLSREELELEVELNYQKIRADIQNMLFKELNDPD